MQKRTITLDELRHPPYIPIKDNYLFQKDGIIYKYRPESQPVMDAYISLPKSEYLKHLALPSIYLYDKNYIGYGMELKAKLHTIDELVNNGYLKEAYTILKKLIDTISFLEDNSIGYWDFHNSNIKISQNSLCILDLDESELNPTEEDKHYTREYLTMFIMNSFTGLNLYIARYLTILEDKHILSRDTINYLNQILNLSTANLPFPYQVLEEFKNPKVQNTIKRLIK